MAVKYYEKESAVERELARRVHALGGRCEKVTVIGSRGFFDRIVVLPGGRIFWVEVKRPRGGKLSEHQKKYRDVYTALGVVVVLIKNSADIDAMLES